MTIARTAVILLLLPAICSAATIFVPDNYPIIQDAINAAVNGDTVIVRVGTYTENIDLAGKDIHLKSESGPALTTIDGNQTGSVVTFTSGEGPGTILEGFTLTNGNALFGGGIYCSTASPSLVGNVITGNTAGGYGGGIFCSISTAYIGGNTITQNSSAGETGGIHCFDSSNPVIHGNLITANTSDSNGGGISCITNSSPTISSNVITYNATYGAGAGILCMDISSPLIVNNIIAWNSVSAATGGGIYCGYSSSPEVLNCTICDNTSGNGGGLFSYSSTPVITNSIVWNNFPNQISGSTPVVTYSDVQGGYTGNGNIDTDPLFVDPAGDDHHLTFNSPCRDAGDGSVPNLPGEDFEGDPRNPGKTVDIGADEFHTHLYHTGAVTPGGIIKVNVVGTPGAAPIILALGSGVQDPPLSTPYGDLYLVLPPVMTFTLGSVPSNGIRTLQATVPLAWQAGDQRPLQALIGPPGNPASVLTNLHTLEVE